MDSELQISGRSFLQRIFFGGSTRNTMIRAGTVVMVSVLVFGFVLRPIRVTGISMSPTYQDRSLNLVNMLSYRFSYPQRGDVVSVGDLAGRENYMKRIIGLPGETVSILGGYVFIDGQPLEEPYVVFREKWERMPQKLGTNEFLVIGDNRGMAKEWHYFGTVERRHILGKVMF